MHIFKKVLGVVFILMGIPLTLSLAVQIPTVLGNVLSIFSASNAQEVGYGIGSLVAFLFFGFIVYLLFRFGIKWLKAPKKKIDPIDSVGEE
ncbi:MAG: hypothetical protein KTR22_07195 [Flavobacteriaceae bacterium]|nr:hypothetical protein [Flavobacteriaceae bacterium]